MLQGSVGGDFPSISFNVSFAVNRLPRSMIHNPCVLVESKVGASGEDCVDQCRSSQRPTT